MNMENAVPEKNDRRLIEEWLPVNEISVDAIREGGALAGHPPVNQLHVWWARRPLIVSRAAVAGSLLKSDADHDKLISTLGTSRQIVLERRAMDAVKARGEWSNISFSNDRAFKHNPTETEAKWFNENLSVEDPLVLDITAGGGSIPFEAGRLGLRSHANDLNPVASLILRATCEWPQKFGNQLLDDYDDIQSRFQQRVEEDCLANVYSQEPLPEDLEEYNQRYAAEIERGETERAQRSAQTYLWARSVSCPSCDGLIPLSPNWRLDSGGAGIRLIPNEAIGKCDFEIVESAARQSPGTIKGGIATCPYPSCGSSTPRGYVAQEAQAGRMEHQLYCVIYRDQWRPKLKSGAFGKRLKTRRGFRTPRPGDDDTSKILETLEQLKPEWDANDVLPNEPVPDGNDRRPHTYGMSPWRKMFSPRQQLAHGYCVQAFRELVNEDIISRGTWMTAVRRHGATSPWDWISCSISTNSLMSLLGGTQKRDRSWQVHSIATILG